MSPELRDKAARICEAAATPETHAQNYAKTAADIGLDVKYDEKDDTGEGPDMEAVEMAAQAWLEVDPEPLGIISPNDPRRDAAAAKMLREGWASRYR